MVFTFILSLNRTSSNLWLDSNHLESYGAAIVSKSQFGAGKTQASQVQRLSKDSSWVLQAKATFPSTLARRSDGPGLEGFLTLSGFT
jgi:hypothetical protein